MNLYCDEKQVGSLRLSGLRWRLEIAQRPAVLLSPHFRALKGQTIESESVQNFFVNYLPEEPFAARVAARITPSPRSFEDWFNVLGQELTGAYALVPAEQELYACRNTRG